MQNWKAASQLRNGMLMKHLYLVRNSSWKFMMKQAVHGFLLELQIRQQEQMEMLNLNIWYLANID